MGSLTAFEMTIGDCLSTVISTARRNLSGDLVEDDIFLENK
jgi:hypothetical protein